MWPLAAGAQQTNVPIVAFLQRTVPMRGDFAHFRDGLAALGYEEGRNVRIEQRYAGGSDARLQELIREIVQLKPAAIVVDGAVVATAVKAATDTIPIVVTIISDPARFGISNLAKPGGNITGFSTFSDVLYAKRLELLKEIVPQLSRVAVLRPMPNLSVTGMRVINDAAPALGLEVRAYDAAEPSTWAALFATIARDKCDGLLQFIDGLFAARTTELVVLAAAQRLPVIYAEREFVDAGGLASYGISYADQWRRAAGYAAKILKGDKPGDLPIEQPTRFEFVINMRTARALGLGVSADLARPRRRGDRVKRREFITLLGGAAAAWPLAARAQQPSAMRRIGVLMLPQPRTIRNFRPASAAFLQALQQLGWIVGRNVRIDTRWATANAADIRRHAAELVALAPDVILAHWHLNRGAVAAGDPHRADRVPGVTDPVGAGFVDSLARPGGNATGFIAFRIRHRAENGWSCSKRSRPA